MKNLPWSKKRSSSTRRPRVDNGSDILFRRSRTLTGSVSHAVASSNESRSQLKTPRLKGHELKKHRRLLSSGFVATIAAAGACLWLLDQYIVSPSDIVSASNIVRPVANEDYVSVIDDYLSQRPAERFLFSLNHDRFSAYMRNKMPEVLDATIVNSPGLVSTVARVTFREPVAVWRVDPERLYVDRFGEAFSRSYYPEPSVAVVDQSGIDPTQQRAIAPVRLLSFIGQIVATIDKQGVGRVEEVTIPIGTLRQLDVKLDSHTFRIKTQMDREVPEQVSDIVSALSYIDENQISPAYLDVRVEGRAYYR